MNNLLIDYGLILGTLEILHNSSSATTCEASGGKLAS